MTRKKLKLTEEDKPRFDRDCRIKKRQYNRARRNNRADPDINDVINASREYREALNKAKAKYLAKKREELRKAQKNPKDYWKILDFKAKKIESRGLITRFDRTFCKTKCNSRK